MRRRSLFAAPLLALATAARAAEPLRVVTSITVLADMIREIGGAHVAVTSLIGPDGDAHAFEPSPADARILAGAGLIVANGLGLDGWLGRLCRAADCRGLIVTATADIAPRRMAEDGRTVADPHAWQDLANGRLYASTIARGLAAADSAHGRDYAAAARAYLARIAATDAFVRSLLAPIPPERRRIVTSHDAFGYFGAAYGVRFEAPEGLAEAAEPSAAAIRRLIDQIRREHIKVLFLENALNPRLIEQIAQETGARIGGTLYADSLSRPGGPADSYLAMFRHNVPLLRDAMLAGGGEG